MEILRKFVEDGYDLDGDTNTNNLDKQLNPRIKFERPKCTVPCGCLYLRAHVECRVAFHV